MTLVAAIVVGAVLGKISSGPLHGYRGPSLNLLPRLTSRWNASFAVPRGEATCGREFERMPLLPAFAHRRLRLP